MLQESPGVRREDGAYPQRSVTDEPRSPRAFLEQPEGPRLFSRPTSLLAPRWTRKSLAAKHQPFVTHDTRWVRRRACVCSPTSICVYFGSRLAWVVHPHERVHRHREALGESGKAAEKPAPIVVRADQVFAAMAPVDERVPALGHPDAERSSDHRNPPNHRRLSIV